MRSRHTPFLSRCTDEATSGRTCVIALGYQTNVLANIGRDTKANKWPLFYVLLADKAQAAGQKTPEFSHKIRLY